MAESLIQRQWDLSSVQKKWLEDYSREIGYTESKLARLVINTLLDRSQKETKLIGIEDEEAGTFRKKFWLEELQYRKLQALAREHGKNAQGLFRLAIRIYKDRLDDMAKPNSILSTAQRLKDIVAFNPTLPGGQKRQGYRPTKERPRARKYTVLKTDPAEEIENLEQQEELRRNQWDQFRQQVEGIVGSPVQPFVPATGAEIRGSDTAFVELLITSLDGSENEQAIDLKKQLEKMLDNG